MKLVAQHLSFQVEDTVILHDIDFNLDSGQAIVISGSSGSGKSLLFSLLSGLMPPTAGRVMYEQTDMYRGELEDVTLALSQLGVVFQQPALLTNLSLYENLELPINQHRSYWDATRRRLHIEKMCMKLGLIPHIHQYVQMLPVGVQAIASLARALILEPKILIWDSVLTNIDDLSTNKITKILYDQKNNMKTSLVLFTNKSRLIGELADLHLHLNDGSGELTVMPSRAKVESGTICS
jgi:ABC-type lipoprotein export system ATPase subunit